MADLAKDGVLFTRAISASSWTRPATASLLTGVGVPAHGLSGAYSDRSVEDAAALSESFLTLGELLRDRGYDTAAWSNRVEGGSDDLTQGFDHSMMRSGTPASGMVSSLDDWLAKRKVLGDERPFFVLLLAYDGHEPYAPDYEWFVRFDSGKTAVPREQYKRYLEATAIEVADAKTRDEEFPGGLRERHTDLYDAQIAQVDTALSHLDEVLERHGAGASTVLAVTSDHGEHFFEPAYPGIGRTGHGRDLADAVLRVPILVRGPGITRGLVVDRVVSTLDLYPTFARLAGARAPDYVGGVTLGPFLYPAGDAANEQRRLDESTDTALEPGRLVDSALHARWRSVQDDRFKLERRDGVSVLRDLRSDPGEIRDVALDHPEAKSRLERALANLQREHEVLRRRFPPRPVLRQPETDLQPERFQQTAGF